MTKGNLHMYVVTMNPSDYPGKIIIRRWTDGKPDTGEPEVIADNLNTARDKLLNEHPGLTRLSRDPKDDPVIVETWI